MAKGNPLLSVRLPSDLHERLEQKIEASGESKSDIAIAALTAYLIPPTPEDEVAQLKRRVDALERRIGL
ncbi:MAG: ribbon-helix-helix protein, CopG family [Stenomitos rutilans HA7619-LM2]|jgi:predicted transcriptional regulator|nr:ribbon-helix-helix protein, CopG family [Stenomitos rutilans HA7619-LM2]